MEAGPIRRNAANGGAIMPEYRALGKPQYRQASGNIRIMQGIDLFNAPLPKKTGTSIDWQDLADGELVLAIANTARQHAGPLLLITGNSAEAERLQRELRFFCGGDGQLPVHLFPDWETLPYDNFSPHQDIISDRLNTLYQLPLLSRGILIVPVNSLMHRLPPHEYVTGGSLVLDAGDHFDIDSMRENLVNAAYNAVDSVYEHGEFAVRGAIMDIFPMGSDQPYRIDLFDDEI